jgi:Na+(H+)/acetate symporter ActP
MKDQSIILFGVAIYLFAMLAIGIVAARRTASSEDFMIAGRSLPLWLCSRTVMATWIGGGSMLGVTPLTQRSDPPRPLLSIDGEEVEFKDRLGLPWNRNS